MVAMVHFTAHIAHIMTTHIPAGFVTSHRAMVHSHIAHGQSRYGANSGFLGAHTGARSKGRNHLTRAINGFSDKSISTTVFWLDDDIISFGDTHLELINFQWLHIKPVLIDNRHGQAGNANIEHAHGSGIDNPQTHPLTGNKHAIPIIGGAVAVDNIGIGSPPNISEITRRHPHTAPHGALAKSLA